MANRKKPSRAAGIAGKDASERKGVTSRRDALRMIGLAAAVGWSQLNRRASGSPVTDSKVSEAPGDEALDQALRDLHRQEPLIKQGLSTHVPMGAEALCVLGFADRVGPWIGRDNSRVHRLPDPSSRIKRESWRAALGPHVGAPSWEASNANWADWREFFVAELSEARWQDVLDLWVGRLSPGMSGAATHGVIRTAHAVRAIARRSTPERRAELARGLAYWASSYEELPARPRIGRRFEAFAEALAEVPLYWEAFGRTPEGRNIVEALRHVRELESFAQVRDLMAAPADLSTALSALTATFARVYLRHGSRHDAIAFVHAVTGPCSLRRLAPHVKPETARAALPYAWQAAAAIYSAYARKSDERRSEDSKLTPAELAARAVENGAVHAIKFTEVMVSEHKLNPDPVYLAAAEDAIKRL